MRELAETGWIANRARLIAASFLTRELFLDWRLGARHFLRTLVDGDVANNAANWQWVAGVGTDAAPLGGGRSGRRPCVLSAHSGSQLSRSGLSGAVERYQGTR